MTEVIEESVVECAVCSTDIAPDNAYETDSCEVVCSDCVRTCDNCSDVGTENDDWNCVDSDLWCQNCTDREAHWCESCEEMTRHDTNYIADRDAYWCDDCSGGTFFCEDCSQYYDQGFCEDCSDSRTIHDYNYRPDPIFHSTKSDERLFFGIEIEVEAGRSLNNAAEYAQQLESMDLAYLKSDGSLNCGFEVVTHPMSHDFFKSEAQDFFDILVGLRNQYNVKSWGTSTCGVHIHISRTGFNGGAHMHRFLNLIYSNQDLYETMAGRSSDRWAKFDDVNHTKWIYDDYGNRQNIATTRSFAHKLNNDRGSDRYSAVNTNNSATLEMRIFKGTTNPRTIMSHIDLAHASVEYTRTMSVKEVAQGALNPTTFVEYIISNEKLYPELVERINRLYIPISMLSASRQEASI
jgi:hypothetical protein